MRRFGFALLMLLAAIVPLAGEDQPYVTCQLKGQLGNQCFEIATTLALAWDNGARPLFPCLLNRTHLGVPQNYKNIFWRLDVEAPKRKAKFCYSLPRKQRGFLPIPYQPDMRLKGHFLSEKYFDHHRERIVEMFAPKKEIKDALMERFGELLNGSSTTVAIHVRTYGHVDGKHGKFCFNGREYVEKAISQFPKDAQFIVCSDNIGWCKENLSDLAERMHFVEGQHYHYDFYLMSLCEHNIISNSTFSWWSAYLNTNPDKIVIAPKNWFRKRFQVPVEDITPDAWIKL